MTQYDADCRYVSKWCVVILVAIAGLLAWFASAQPVITRLTYQVCIPTQDGVEYTADNPKFLREYINDTNLNQIFSGSATIADVGLITISWQGTPNHSYALESTPVLGLPFTQFSPWVSNNLSTSFVFTQAFTEAQCFIRIIQR